MHNKKKIQREFGQNAQSYVESTTHRLGASLARLLELITLRPNWQMLDVATAVGYTAFAFAPHVGHVWATDITREMLDLAQQEASSRGISNVTVEYADAEKLPYDDATFDLVTCRIAPHHFGDVDAFIREAARTLRPGGTLAVVDNVVPDGPGGDYVNAFEKLRDPSHGRCLSMAEWIDAFAAADFAVTHSETLEKVIDFEFWTKRHNVHTRRFLRTMLAHAPRPAAEFLRPYFEEDTPHFHLQEGIIIGQKPD